MRTTAQPGCVLLLVLDVVVTVCAALAGTHRVHWVAGWLHARAEAEGAPTLL